MVGDMVSTCPLHSSKVLCVWCITLTSHFAAPMGQLYGWLPLSNAYGISSVATQHKSNDISLIDNLTIRIKL